MDQPMPRSQLLALFFFSSEDTHQPGVPSDWGSSGICRVKTKVPQKLKKCSLGACPQGSHVVWPAEDAERQEVATWLIVPCRRGLWATLQHGLCGCVCLFLSLCVCARECSCPQRPEEGSEFQWSSHYRWLWTTWQGCLGLNLVPLQEQYDS